MSAKIPNDQFLLYAFDGEPADLDRVLEQICDRARACPDMGLRIDDGCVATYPRWVSTAIGPERVIRHHLGEPTWPGCLVAVAGLAGNQLDIRRLGWRMHIFTPVWNIPGVDGPGTVAVMQVAHALGDGARASAMAAWLFGRATPVAEVATPASGFLPWRAIDAARTYRQLNRDTSAGLLAPGVGSRPLLATNTRPERVRTVRTLVRHRAQLPGPTVTVGVLAAVAEALSGQLGGCADSLGAEVPMAKPGTPQAHNHFANIVVGLYPQLRQDDRVRRIAADLANGRRRLQHPAARSSERAFAAVPAALLRWGVAQFDSEARPTQVAGNTVVSSVHRGAADLSFGAAQVVFTAGYPALSPVVGLTHGVHGIGDTVAISVHAAETAVPDIDAYLSRLEAAL